MKTHEHTHSGGKLPPRCEKCGQFIPYKHKTCYYRKDEWCQSPGYRKFYDKEEQWECSTFSVKKKRRKKMGIKKECSQHETLSATAISYTKKKNCSSIIR
jgi:hypothetical protein